MRNLFLLIISAIVLLSAAFFISQQPSYLLIAIVVVPLVFIASFVNPGIGLYILIFSMLLSPEFQVGETHGSSLGRGVTLRIEDFLLLVIGASWFFRNAIDKNLGLFMKTPLNKPIMFYILACVTATGFGIIAGRINAATGMFYVLKYIEYFLVFYMVINHTRTETQVRRFVFCLLLTCFIVSIIGIFQIPGGDRVSAPFEGEVGEPNTFGGYLVFIMAIAAGLFYWVRELKTRQLLLVLMAAIIPPLMFTESRASYLAFIPMIIAMGMMMPGRVIIVGTIAGMLIISPLFLPAAVKDRVMYTFNQPPEPGQAEIAGIRIDTSTSARLRNWSGAIIGWPAHPLFGYGVTGYGFVDAQFPRVLAETGLFGMAAFLMLLFMILRMAVLHYQMVTTPFAKGLCMGYIAGFIGLIFHSLGANTFIIVRIMEPFWFFTGLIFILPLTEAGSSMAAGDSMLLPVKGKSCENRQIAG